MAVKRSTSKRGSDMKSTSSRRRNVTTAMLAAGALALGVGFGAGGSTLARWQDGANPQLGSINWGYEYFGAGQAKTPAGVVLNPVALTTPTAGGVVTLDSAGPALATALLASSDGKAAVAFRVDSISQGNKGLKYSVVGPTWNAGTVLANTTTTLFKVSSLAACTPTATPPSPNPQNSVPVSSAYSTVTAVTSEFWCLTVSGTMPDVGSYSNTAGATATNQAGGQVTATPAPAPASNAWAATVTTAFLAANQNPGSVTFTYQTFRGTP